MQSVKGAWGLMGLLFVANVERSLLLKRVR